MSQLKNTKTAQLVREQAERIMRRQQRLLGAYEHAAQQGRAARMNYLNRQVQEASQSLLGLGRIAVELQREKDNEIRRYVISSMFLAQCARDLTADRNEQFFFITGPEVDGICVLEKALEFQHTQRSEVSVIGVPTSTHRLLIKLEQLGHRLLGHFHSHPGKGTGMTVPSGKDRTFQNRLESAGYPTVAAIFSRDGYVRFFRLDEQIEVRVHGNGVEEIEPNIFRIREID